MKKTTSKTTTTKTGSEETAGVGRGKITFQFDKETPGAVRFQELGKDGEPNESMDDGLIGTLYVRKAGLKRLGVKDLPEGCTVTISFT